MVGEQDEEFHKMIAATKVLINGNLSINRKPEDKIRLFSTASIACMFGCTRTTR